MLTFNAQIRNNKGKSSNRRLRIINKFPAIIYGNKKPSISIELWHDPVKNIEIKSEFYNEIIFLIIENKKIKVKIQAIQRHPFKEKITHIDFIYI
ncbi:50S ribosomal protein L25 [Serratia symbiotica]|nr:50S ribosomal protein L25 [Serratia symbiotica]